MTPEESVKHSDEYNRGYNDAINEMVNQYRPRHQHQLKLPERQQRERRDDRISNQST